MTEPDTVDTRIPAELHPACIESIAGFDDPEINPLLAPTQTAFSEAYQGLQKVFAAREFAKKNAALTEAAQVLQTSDFANKVLARITKRVDAVSNNLAKSIASLESDLTAPIIAKAGGTISGEVRAHVKGLNTGQRMEVIRQAIDSGDHIVATSVLGAPAILSGLDNATLAHLIRHYNETHHPSIVKRHAALVAAKKMLDDRSGLVFTTMERAVGKTSEKVKVLRDAHNASERAFSLSEA